MESLGTIKFIEWIIFFGVPALVGIIWKMVKSNLEDQNEELHRMKEVQAEWQLELVKNYATKIEVDRTELRMLSAIERIENKLDRVLKLPGN